MQSQDEIAEGIGILKQYVLDRGLSLSERRLRDTRSYHFEIRKDDKWFDFVLSDEFLMDLPATPSHKADVAEYLPPILARFQNFSPRDFLAKSAVPFELQIHWPFRQHPSRDATWCHADVKDTRLPDQIALTTPTILGMSAGHSGPFARIEAVVNAVRDSLDKSEIQFYKRSQHPSETQEIPILDRLEFARLPEDSVEEFLSNKLFWLAFRRGDQSTRVWIADPWDATYLGVSVRELVRAAQILKARDMLVLSSDGQFASPGDALLRHPPIPTAPRPRIGFQVSNQ